MRPADLEAGLRWFKVAVRRGCLAVEHARWNSVGIDAEPWVRLHLDARQWSAQRRSAKSAEIV